MSEEGEAGELAEFGDGMSALSAPLMKLVMKDVVRERGRQDGDLGAFRDYPDGTAGRAVHGPTISRDRESSSEAQRRRHQADTVGKTTWRHLLEEAVGYVIAEGREKQLRDNLIQLAAHSVAWVEAIDRRKDEKRIEAKTRAKWWTRVIAWLRRKR